MHHHRDKKCKPVVVSQGGGSGGGGRKGAARPASSLPQPESAFREIASRIKNSATGGTPNEKRGLRKRGRKRERERERKLDTSALLAGAR